MSNQHDLNNYKGIYFDDPEEDTKDKFGAHFRADDLIRRLEALQAAREVEEMQSHSIRSHEEDPVPQALNKSFQERRGYSSQGRRGYSNGHQVAQNHQTEPAQEFTNQPIISAKRKQVNLGARRASQKPRTGKRKTDSREGSASRSFDRQKDPQPKGYYNNANLLNFMKEHGLSDDDQRSGMYVDTSENEDFKKSPSIRDLIQDQSHDGAIRNKTFSEGPDRGTKRNKSSAMRGSFNLYTTNQKENRTGNRKGVNRRSKGSEDRFLYQTYNESVRGRAEDRNSSGTRLATDSGIGRGSRKSRHSDAFRSIDQEVPIKGKSHLGHNPQLYSKLAKMFTQKTKSQSKMMHLYGGANKANKSSRKSAGTGGSLGGAVSGMGVEGKIKSINTFGNGKRRSERSLEKAARSDDMNRSFHTSYINDSPWSSKRGKSKDFMVENAINGHHAHHHQHLTQQQQQQHHHQHMMAAHRNHALPSGNRSFFR